MDKYKKIIYASIISFSLLLISSFLIFFSPPEQEQLVLGIGEIAEQKDSNLKQFLFKNQRFLYNDAYFFIEEGEDNVVLLPKNTRNFQYASLGSVETNDTSFEMLPTNPLYPNLLKEDTIIVGKYEIQLYSYDQISFLGNVETRRGFVTTYSTTTPKEQTYFIEVRDFNYKNFPSTHNQFLEIIKSLEQDKEVLGSNNTQVDLARILTQSSTVRIFSRTCYDAKFSSDLQGSLLSGNTYTICGAIVGSGFVVSPYGDILTNAHIVKPNKFDCMVNGISIDGAYEIIMGQEVGNTLKELLGDFSMFLSQNQVETFYVYLINEIYKMDYLTITEKNKDIYVQTDTSFDFDNEAFDLKNKDLQYTATLIKANDIASYYQTLFNSMDESDLFEEGADDTVEFTKLEDGLTGVSDLALIRLDIQKPFPSLKLSEQKPMQGQNIYVVGFPQISNDELTTSSTNILTSTVTTGSITSIKQNTKNTFDLLQIDASIESGNSGGPIADNLGNILGITTYSTSSGSGNYNLGISSTEISNFLADIGIANEHSEQSNILISAVSDISKEYYSRSQKKLNELTIGESTLGVTLNPLIELCNTNINLGNDKSPWIDLKFIDIPNWGLLLIGGIILVLLILILIILISKAKKKKAEYAEPMFKGPELQTPTDPIVNAESQTNEPERGYLRPQQPQTTTQPQPIPTNVINQNPVQPLTPPQQAVPNIVSQSASQDLSNQNASINQIQQPVSGTGPFSNQPTA